ncbi:MAG: DUF2207 domain-containing protein [Armatimonadetes bacterium]|nr:DUF2207 domain-containing protein [Armatimonadota bacterium]
MPTMSYLAAPPFFQHWPMPFLLLALVLPAVTSPAATIQEFDSLIDLQKDSSFTVSERIVLDSGASGEETFERVLPVVLDRKPSVGATDLPVVYSVRLQLLSVTDAQGRTLPVEVTREGRRVRLRIGGPDRPPAGDRTYQIKYRVTRAINYFPTADEFYWNATGAERDGTIQRARVRVQLPPGTDPEQVHAKVMTGPEGTEPGAVQGEGEFNDQIFVATAGPLKAGESLAVALGFPKGVLQNPDPFKRTLWILSDNAVPLAITLLSLLGIVAVLVLLSRRKTRAEMKG